MEMFLSLIANLIESVAGYGAGFMSAGIMYEPEVPEELQ